MTSEPRSRRRRRKRILRRSDGSLYDVSERRSISQSDLMEYVRDGGVFEARRKGSGRDCTYEVLQSMMGTGLLENAVPGLSGGPLAALGGAGGLGGLGSLGNLARLLGQQLPQHDRDFDDEPPRRSRRRDSEWDGNGWDEPPRRSDRASDKDWHDWDEAEPD